MDVVASEGYAYPFCAVRERWEEQARNQNQPMQVVLYSVTSLIQHLLAKLLREHVHIVQKLRFSPLETLCQNQTTLVHLDDFVGVHIAKVVDVAP